MEVFPVSATPLSSAVPVSRIELEQSALVRNARRDLVGESSNVSITDIVDVSQTGRLLSSVVGIGDAANATDAGVAIDNASVIEEARRFVDSVNGLSLDAQDALGGLSSLATVANTAASVTNGIEAEAPGIDIVSAGDEDNTLILTLDSEALIAALESDAAATTSLLAAFALPVAASAATQAGLAQANQSFIAESSQPDLLLPSNGLLSIEASAVDESAVPVVPDLTIENNELRQALADTALADIVRTVANVETVPLSVFDSPAPALQEESLEAQVTSAPASLPEVPADVQSAPLNATNPTVTLSADVPEPLLVEQPAAVPGAALLTPLDLVTTPLEQITQLAANPTVAGAVAAFLIPADDGRPVSRAGDASGSDEVKPIAAVSATTVIEPNLPHTTEQQQSKSPELEANANRWLATRPGLV